jgi:hypothetical protein
VGAHSPAALVSADLLKRTLANGLGKRVHAARVGSDTLPSYLLSRPEVQANLCVRTWLHDAFHGQGFQTPEMLHWVLSRWRSRIDCVAALKCLWACVKWVGFVDRDRPIDCLVWAGLNMYCARLMAV